jgi:hypothetical protein
MDGFIRRIAAAAIQSYCFYDSETDAGSDRAMELAIDSLDDTFFSGQPTMTYADLSPDERTRLRAAFDAGFSLGSGAGRQLDTDPALVALLDAVMDDWFVGCEVAPDPPEWLRAFAERMAFETAPLRGMLP